jgi:hypothetical protein
MTLHDIVVNPATYFSSADKGGHTFAIHALNYTMPHERRQGHGKENVKNFKTK